MVRAAGQRVVPLPTPPACVRASRVCQIRPAGRAGVIAPAPARAVRGAGRGLCRSGRRGGRPVFGAELSRGIYLQTAERYFRSTMVS